MKYGLILIVVFCGLFNARSEPASGTNAPPSRGTEGLRDPFWPVGYEPKSDVAAPSVPVVVATAKVNWPKLTVKGITRDAQGSYQALLDPVGIVKPGQDIKVIRGGVVYTWHITDIDATGIKHRKTGVRPPGEGEQGSGQPRILIRKGAELFKRPPAAARESNTE